MRSVSGVLLPEVVAADDVSRRRVISYDDETIRPLSLAPTLTQKQSDKG